MKKTSLFIIGNLIALNLAFSQGTAINTSGTKADKSAILDLNSSNQGFLMPRLSTTQRDSILGSDGIAGHSPVEGLQIYNTTTRCFEAYISGAWYAVSCPCPSPSAPVSSTHNSYLTEIEWNWNAVSGATGYKWCTTSDYNSATDNGASTSYTQPNLNCETAYTLYVWVYNACGNSTYATFTESTASCFTCNNPLPVNHTTGNGVAPAAKSVNYGTILTTLGGTGAKCWITQNLGSANQATSPTDASENASGWYWQFNLKQGYKHDGATRTPNTVWITSINESSDWIAGNDPCTIELGSGWRIPTSTEWNNADATGGWNNYNDTYNSILKLHAGGYLDAATSDLTQRGFAGLAWSSTQNTSTQGKGLLWVSNGCNPYTGDKAYAFTMRCLKD